MARNTRRTRAQRTGDLARRSSRFCNCGNVATRTSYGDYVCNECFERRKN